jgi:putative transcriptional regulator
VSDLLFLYECETREVSQLRSIAERLGLSVQAASHTFRSLARRGLAEIRDGRYRPTVRGVDWLHSALGSVRDDLAERLDRLHIVRTTPAIASVDVAAGQSVRLEIRDGVLTATPGATDGSRGRVRQAAGAGEVVEVGELEGIVPLPFGRLQVVAFPHARLADPSLPGTVHDAVRAARPGLLAAFGLGAYHVLARAAPDRQLVRFGVAAALMEATSLGVNATVVVADRDLPRLFLQFDRPETPEFEFLPLGKGGGHRATRGRPQRRQRRR